MKHIFTLLACCLLLITACKKENKSKSNIIPLTGIYFESEPTWGRARLNFISEHLVVRSEKNSDYRDTFSYEVTNKQIILKDISQSFAPTIIPFEQISAIKFKIGNLYPSVPENPPTYMIFEK